MEASFSPRSAAASRASAAAEAAAEAVFRPYFSLTAAALVARVGVTLVEKSSSRAFRSATSLLPYALAGTDVEGSSMRVSAKSNARSVVVCTVSRGVGRSTSGDVVNCSNFSIAFFAR